MKVHDIHLWHHLSAQRDRLVCQYARELQTGHTLTFMIPGTWCACACNDNARALSEDIAAAGVPNTAQVHREPFTLVGRNYYRYTITIEGA